jgi:pimeloyl-ACP methyl ester carboxylesterase
MESATLAARPPRAVTLPRKEVHPVRTSDGTEIRLTRYPGTRGPIVLAPGYGNAARAFTVETVDRNFVEFLSERDYDVWLLDYRASPELQSSWTQFTVDDIAMRDWPAAIGAIRQETGADSVHALAHCVGAMSLFMAIGGGLEGLGSATFSALGGHPIPTPANRVRAGVRLASMLKAAGVTGLNTDYDPSSPADRAVDLAMRAPGFRHVCDSPVCRRICFVYGDVFDHAHLNDATHEALAGIFGISNLTFFEHISMMIRKAQVADVSGGDAYLSHLDRYRMPITFLHGEHNRMFLPRSTEKSYQTLVEANGPELYHRHVIPDYAHLDCWLGQHADRDVFPLVASELERMGA